MNSPSPKIRDVLKQFAHNFSTANHSRTISILVLFLIIAAIPLTVFISQQQQDLRQRATGTNTAPACDTGQLTMSKSPNIIRVGDTFTLSLSGNQGSTWISNTFDPNRVNCTFAVTWPTQASCTAVSEGDVTWTHGWKNCPADDVGCRNGNVTNASAQCSKQLSFRIDPASGSPTPPQVPPPTAKIKTGNSYSIRRIDTTVGTPIAANTLRAELNAGSGTTLDNNAIIITKVTSPTNFRPLVPGQSSGQTIFDCDTPNQVYEAFNGNLAGRYCFINSTTVQSGTSGSITNNAWIPSEPGTYVVLVDNIEKTSSGAPVKCSGSPFGSDTSIRCDAQNNQDYLIVQVVGAQPTCSVSFTLPSGQIQPNTQLTVGVIEGSYSPSSFDRSLFWQYNNLYEVDGNGAILNRFICVNGQCTIPADKNGTGTHKLRYAVRDAGAFNNPAIKIEGQTTDKIWCTTTDTDVITTGNAPTATPTPTTGLSATPTNTPTPTPTATPLAAPTGLQANCRDDLVMELRWNSVTGAQSYVFQLIDSNSTPPGRTTDYPNAQIPSEITQSPYFISGMIAGHTYDAIIRSKNAQGLGGIARVIEICPGPTPTNTPGPSATPTLTPTATPTPTSLTAPSDFSAECHLVSSSLRLDMDWTFLSTATTYSLTILDRTADSTITRTTPEDHLYLPAVAGHTYRISLRGVNTQGMGQIATINPPACPGPTPTNTPTPSNTPIPPTATATPTNVPGATATARPNLAADVDRNGCIDIKDFNEWLYAFQNNGSPRNASYRPNIKGRGVVDIQDFNLWYRAFQSGENKCSS